MGTKSLLEGDLSEAMNCFFKSAAIACNVTFTAKTHGVELPESFMNQMCVVADRATHGIKKVMKMVAMKKILEHESVMHPVAAALGVTEPYGSRPSELAQAYMELRDARAFLKKLKEAEQRMPGLPVRMPYAAWAEQRAMNAVQWAEKARAINPGTSGEVDDIIEQAQAIIGKTQLTRQSGLASMLAGNLGIHREKNSLPIDVDYWMREYLDAKARGDLARMSYAVKMMRKAADPSLEALR